MRRRLPAGEPTPQPPNPQSDTSKLDQAGKDAAWKAWGHRLAEQQRQIDLLRRELDVLREYPIRAAAMYADAGNRLRSSADWDRQDAQETKRMPRRCSGPT